MGGRSNRSDFRKSNRVTVDGWAALAGAYGRTLLLLLIRLILKIYLTGNVYFAYLFNLKRHTYFRGVTAWGKCHDKQKHDQYGCGNFHFEETRKYVIVKNSTT